MHRSPASLAPDTDPHLPCFGRRLSFWLPRLLTFASSARAAQLSKRDGVCVRKPGLEHVGRRRALSPAARAVVPSREPARVPPRAAMTPRNDAPPLARRRQVERVIRSMDADQDGMVGWPEYLRAMARQLLVLRRPQPRTTASARLPRAAPHTRARAHTTIVAVATTRPGTFRGCLCRCRRDVPRGRAGYWGGRRLIGGPLSSAAAGV